MCVEDISCSFFPLHPLTSIYLYTLYKKEAVLLFTVNQRGSVLHMLYNSQKWVSIIVMESPHFTQLSPLSFISKEFEHNCLHRSQII